MMIRSLQRAARLAPFVPARALSTVQENSIKLVFVDREGNRATLPARIGSTLLETTKLHKIDLEGPCNGGGASIDTIPSRYDHLLPPHGTSDQKGLKDVWEEEFNVTSRLACQITLEKKHDGMVVFVPDAPPVDLI